ncbi:cell envelope integrity protein TolA [Maritimibacter alkaliphilus]|uniref:cell envelope integrity protein TolA n=1 Tax=Maritimibacter alkaliphilus TaxID=404236 RepID=UPI001C9542A0|nr:energy transducer TonB [Maritimibacter alkaliphilus]MBY6092453.1 TonB family protein [Maritimibacter alkaliphilus]
MIRIAELLAFVALAVGVHILFALRLDTEDGADAGGQGGDAMVTLAAATAQMETMVEQWERPPELDTPQDIAPAPVETPVAEAPRLNSAPPDLAPVQSAAIQLPSMTEERPDTPEIDLSTPPPPEPEPEPEPEIQQSELAPQSSPRPPERPEAPRERPQPKPEPKRQAQVAEKAQQSSAGSAAQKSAGSGGSAFAGNSGRTEASTMSKAQSAKLETVWGAKIRAKIARYKRFPRGVRGGGRVVLSITVTPSGQVAGAGIARSSGNGELDRAALQAVQRAGRMPAAPSGLTNARYSFALPMSFD